MPEVTSPFWLGLLVPVVLLIWWLHRFREHPARTRISAVFLWRNLRQPVSPGSRQDRADPVWLLRALIAALLLIALSGVAWIGTSERHITVWFDDSLSMKAEEAKGIRWSLAASALNQELKKEEVQRIDIRSLTRTGNRIELGTGDWDSLLPRLQPWFRQPTSDPNRQLPPLPLDPGEHWLVTDGAGEGLGQWLKKGAVNRIIPIGKETENSAVTRLGVRPSLGRADRIEGLIEVWNGGERADHRRLELLVDDRRIREWSITIPPEGTLSHSFVLPSREGQRITARLLSAGGPTTDRLAEDDQLSVRLLAAHWKPRISLTGDCGIALESALQSLPGTTLSRGDGGGDVSVTCSATPPTSSGPVVWFPPQDAPHPPSGPLRWSPEADQLGRLTLDPDQLLTGSTDVSATARPLLTAGKQPLILRHPGPVPVLEVRLDMVSSPFVHHPTYPLLLSGLLELATGHPLLDRVLANRRDPAESRIAPLSLESVPSGPSMESSRPEATDPSRWLILAAIGLLLYDIGRISPYFRHRTSTRRDQQ